MLQPEPQPGPSPEELQRLEAAKKAEEERKAEEDKQRIEAQKKAEAEKKQKEEEAERKRREALKKKQEEAKRLAEAKKKAEEKKAKDTKSFEDKMAELIDKSPELLDKDPRQAAAGGAPTESSAKAKGPVAGAPEGRDDRLTASQSAMLGLLVNKTYSEGWLISCGSAGVNEIVVKVAVNLKPDGYLADPPKVVNRMSGPLFGAMADAALRAVEKAQPVDFPPDLYKGGWESFTINFDARKRCGQG
jgi:colicin import membrane protein